ncbi:hypothetical protein Tco_1376386 [Tanacetum coccineum]
MHIFIGCFIYVVDFMILEDLGNIIDCGLSEVVLGKRFGHTSKLTYDDSLGLIKFSQRDDKLVFRMPQRTKELDLVSSLENDKFEAFFVENLKVFSTWMAFGGNTPNLGSFGEETDKITDLHQILEEVLLTERGDGITGIKRRRRNPSSDGVRRFSDSIRTYPT